METFVKAPAAVSPSAPQKSTLLSTFSLLFYPTGVYQIWRGKYPLWARLLYTLLGLPVFLLVFTFLSVVVFALFLPPLDLSMGNRTDRTVYSKKGNYATTFLKTGRETGGAYELIRVELEPQGGNTWHYHKTFDEYFQVEEGEMEIGLDGKKIRLTRGQHVTAPRNRMHYFKNPTASKAVLLAKTLPARGLEKTIRIGYGLANDGLTNEEGIPTNLWHLSLLLGYSESYMEGIPVFIQELLFPSLAKIAQWKGEDKALEKYFR